MVEAAIEVSKEIVAFEWARGQALLEAFGLRRSQEFELTKWYSDAHLFQCRIMW